MAWRRNIPRSQMTQAELDEARAYDRARYARPDQKERAKARKRQRYIEDPDWEKRIRDRARVNRNRGGFGSPPEGSSCALCGSPGGDTHGTRLFWDHCHMTGKRRDVLCGMCNMFLGQLETDWGRVQRFMDYSESWKAINLRG